MTARHHLLSLLERHVATDDKERSDLSQMSELARTLEDPFSREQLPGHFTASAVVVESSFERVCLVHHRKLGRWLQPGGHLEQGDQGRVDLAALREVREETALEVELFGGASLALDVDIHTIPGRPEMPAHDHLDVRFLVVSRGTSLRHDPSESLTARFYSWEEALALPSDPAFVRMLEKARLTAKSARSGSERRADTPGA